MQDNKERLPNKGPINMAAIASISQERGNRPHRAEPEEDREPYPTTSAPRSSHNEDTLGKLERRVSLMEESQFTMMEELRRMQQE